MRLIDKSFIRTPKNYIIQSLLATLAVAIILYFVEVLTQAAIVAALGSSTFIVFALSVGLSIFLMAITNTEHPPAAGTALGIIAHEWSYQVIMFVLISAISLAIIRRLLRNYLRDLF